MHFRSSRMVQKGSLGVVLDVRIDVEPCAIVIRVAPFGSRPPFELSVGADDIEPASSLPDGVGLAPDVLPGGFRAADLVFATADLGAPAAFVGRGDAGIAFGPGREAPEDTVLVRFEARQDTWEPVWVSVPPRGLSHEPQLCTGRRVCLKRPLAFADGCQLQEGCVGVVVQSVHEQGDKDVVSFACNGSVKSFVPVEGTLSVLNETRPLHEEDLAMRLDQLEYFAQANEEAGCPAKTVSLLEQNLWALFGLGCGIGIGFLSSDRIWTLANDLRCQSLRLYKNEGLSGTLDNESGAQFNHQALVTDQSRVDPYAAAIHRASRGRRVLDIGTGPLCLLSRLCLRAGARSVDAIEASERSVRSAIEGFRCGEGASCEGRSGAPIPQWAALGVPDLALHDAGSSGGLCLSLRVEAAAGAPGAAPQMLRLYHGLSTQEGLALEGGYNLLVHEILGDIAGTEDAAAVVEDIRRRKLLTEDCAVVPRSSSTMLAPTSKLQFSVAEGLIHRLQHQGSKSFRLGVRYRAGYFHRENLLAEPQALEELDFAGGSDLRQERRLEFRTARAGGFDGLHMHLYVDLDSVDSIDVLKLHSCPDRKTRCSWNTTYICLLDEPIDLPAGSRILCECHVDLGTIPSRYSVDVSVGEVRDARHVAHVEWRGG